MHLEGGVPKVDKARPNKKHGFEETTKNCLAKHIGPENEKDSWRQLCTKLSINESSFLSTFNITNQVR